MEGETSTRSVERMFPFVLRAKILMVGRDMVRRNKGKLHFVLITEDISQMVRDEILEDFKHYPVVQHYTSADFEKHFAIAGARTIGFRKSGLAQSIYNELKAYRINQPIQRSKRDESLPAPPSARKASKRFPSRRPTHP